jgi:hypothetical protein
LPELMEGIGEERTAPRSGRARTVERNFIACGGSGCAGVWCVCGCKRRRRDVSVWLYRCQVQLAARAPGAVDSHPTVGRITSVQISSRHKALVRSHEQVVLAGDRPILIAIASELSVFPSVKCLRRCYQQSRYASAQTCVGECYPPRLIFYYID